MPTVAELMANPEVLEREANLFADMCVNASRPHDDMNSGIKTADEFCELLSRCGNSGIDYKRLCEIGAND